MINLQILSLFVTREPIVPWRQERRSKMAADILWSMSRTVYKADAVHKALLALGVESLVKYAG